MRLLSILLFIFISIAAFGQQKDVRIHFKKNIELFGYLVHLAEPLYSDPEHPVTLALNRSETDRTHPVLPRIFELSSDMTYAFLVDLLYTLPPLPLQEGFDTDAYVKGKYGHKTPEEAEKISTIIAALDEFVQTADFGKIWEHLAPYRTEVLDILEKNKPSASFLAQMEEVYQQEFSIYEIVPSLTVWPTAGWGFRKPEAKKAVYILGPLEKDYDYNHPEKFLNLALHEFGHSFVNGVVLKHTAAIRQTKSLFAPLKESMRLQGYPGWEDCLVEHFVRAGEIFVPDPTGKQSQTGDLLRHYTEDRQFVYLPFVVDKLTTYRGQQGLSYEQAVQQTLEDLKKRFLPDSE
ncbi:DUF4932 domain-containing protein [Robertkochia flava]|uniref:DUF4932 domain-containing protein n=1 Tax=Robertkochia flava TaxID=3447986 RepID=UPI001CC954D2|nr:DUF4932 domain-containing protein [Robertkochia marina]